MLEDVTPELIKLYFPDYSSSKIADIYSDYLRDKAIADKGKANLLNSYKTQEKDKVNRWKSDESSLFPDVELGGVFYQVSIENLNTLRLYGGYLPEGVTWTTSDNKEIPLTPELIDELIAEMVKAISSRKAEIHKEARRKKELIEQLTEIPK